MKTLVKIIIFISKTSSLSIMMMLCCYIYANNGIRLWWGFNFQPWITWYPYSKNRKCRNLWESTLDISSLTSSLAMKSSVMSSSLILSSTLPSVTSSRVWPSSSWSLSPWPSWWSSSTCVKGRMQHRRLQSWETRRRQNRRSRCCI